MKMTELQKMYLRARGRWSRNLGQEEAKKQAKQFAELRDQCAQNKSASKEQS